MLKILSIVVFVFSIQGLVAQMDEKFYYPDKEWLDIGSFDHREIIMYADRDTIHSVLFKPAGTPKATVLYFHGNGSNISKWTGHIEPLVNDGFQVCMLDYRGYGRSSGTPTHLNIAHDAQMLLDTLLAMDDVRHTKLIVYGASIGTQVAAHITRTNNDKVSALIFDSMMTSFTDVALLTTPEEYHQYVKQLVTSPYSAREDIEEIKDIRILFIHSEDDPIPISGAKEIFDISPCGKTFWIYEGAHVEAPVKYPEVFVGYMNELIK